MRLTKTVLREHHIFNPYNLSDMVGTQVFIEYVPADNGRLTAHYAYWRMIRKADSKQYAKQFTVTHREVKQIVLQEAIAYVKNVHHINITDKDAFGGYHPEGTLGKLERMVVSPELEN